MSYRPLSALYLYSICLVVGCDNAQGTVVEVPNEYIPVYTKAIDIELPQFLPCPEGWVETNFDAGQGHIIPYCAPPEYDPENPTMTPRAPAPPNFLPCPVGWREVEDETTGVVTCDPFPEGGQMDCDSFGFDYAHFPGEQGCVRIGTECPEGQWATNLPTDRNVYYVQAGGSLGGNGTELNPYGSIGEALEQVGSDAVLALSKGTFDESIELPRGIVLWGACVAETVVTSSIASEDALLITTYFPDTGLRNLLVTGPCWGVLVHGNFASMHIEDVVFINVYMAAIEVYSGAATVRHVAVRETQSRQRDGVLGRGLQITAGATVEVSRAVFSRHRDIAIFAYGPNSHLTLRDVLVNDTLGQQNDGNLGLGLYGDNGVTVEVSRSVFNKNRESAIFVTGTNTHLTLRDVLVNETQSQQSDATNGIGLFIRGGAKVEVSRSVFSKNRTVGVFPADPQTHVTLDDILVNDTQSQESDGFAGRGLNIEAGAKVEVSRAVFSKNREIGVSASGTGTHLTLGDVLVNDTQSQQIDGELGRGLEVQAGAKVEVSHSVFSRNRETGISAMGTEVNLTLDDVVVNDTQSRQSDGMGGRGLNIQNGPNVEVSRSVFIKNTGAGIVVRGIGTNLNLHYVLVNENQSVQNNGTLGRGLSVQYGANVDVSRSVFLKNRDIGIFVAAPNTRAKLQDILVANTLQMKSIPIDWESNPMMFTSGRGIGSYGQAYVEATRFVFSKHEHCGAQVARGADEYGNDFEFGGAMILSHGIISNNALCGINVQTEPFDLKNIYENVIYFGNNFNNLDTQYLSTPNAMSWSEPG